jgi:hypothetical protein
MSLQSASNGKHDTMTEFGYPMMCEQSGPRELVADLVAAEQAGFDFSVISDLPAVAGIPRPRALRVVGARCSCPGD